MSLNIDVLAKQIPQNNLYMCCLLNTLDKLVKSRKLANLSFSRKRVSSNYKQLWMPDQVGNDKTAKTPTFCETVIPALCSTPRKKASGRSRQTVDSYIADLRAVTQMGLDINIFRMNRLGIPRDRIAKRLGVKQVLIHNHLSKMATLPNSINADLSRGFTVAQVAEKYNWTEPMVWSLALKDKEDLERFTELGWGLRTWDQWEWKDCDKRFGDDWPGRIPA